MVSQFSSTYALAIDIASESKLSALFFDEARRNLDKENGKASLAASQALPLLYLYCTCAAKDRLGLMYRYTGCDMYKRMKSGVRVPVDPSAQDAVRQRKLASRHAWGLFYLETPVHHLTVARDACCWTNNSAASSPTPTFRHP
jgi:hypothetical protein